VSVHRAASGRYVVKFREGGRSRTLTVSRKNLVAFGLQASATEKKA
jgi:hypothetical protein